MILRRLRGSRGGFAAASIGTRDSGVIRPAYWRATAALAAGALAAFAGMALLVIAAQSGSDSFAGPGRTLLLWAAGPITGVLLAFAFSRVQDTLDRAFRIAEAD